MSLIQRRPRKDTGKYNVLQSINYEQLGVRFFMDTYPVPDCCKPVSLVTISAQAICMHSEHLVREAVLTVPIHVVNCLLKQAILLQRAAVICDIVANWPATTLCWREVMGEDNREIFLEKMGLDVLLFKGLIRRTQHCQMTTLDLRGFPLNENFSWMIIRFWPLLSLKKGQRNANRLTNVVLKKIGNIKDNKLLKEVIPKFIIILSHEMMQHSDFGIHLPRGVKMTVKIDCLKFTPHEAESCLNYIITSCLRSLTPLTVDVQGIIIRSDLRIGDDLQMSAAPFIVLKGQGHENLKGVCLEDLEERVLFDMSPNVTPLSNITSLGLLNCNICLQEGRTRSRTSDREKFVSFLASFPHLRRLDLSMNSFAGCLEEILGALEQPLEYLNLGECDINNKDMWTLAASKHSASLRHLNLCRVCGLFVDDTFAVSGNTLIESIRSFPRLTILDLSRNQLNDSMTGKLCDIVSSHLTELKSVNLSENLFTVNGVIKLLRTCVRLKSLCHLHIPHSHNLMDALNDLPEQSREQFKDKIHEVLKETGRDDDIAVEITANAFAMI